jgi:hypothetical protein
VVNARRHAVVGMTLATVLLVLITVGASAGPRRCRIACGDAVAACVADGGRKVACRKSLRRACRRQGVAACQVATTTTTLLVRERWCYYKLRQTPPCSPGPTPWDSCPSSPSGSFDLDIAGANVTGTWSTRVDYTSTYSHPVSGSYVDDVLDLLATGCTVSFPGGNGDCSGYVWQSRWIARGTGAVRPLTFHTYAHFNPSSGGDRVADFEGALWRCERP